MDIVLAILSFIVVLGVLVLVHELGHFLVARLFGVGVDEFGFGFPPRLWGKRVGNTTYTINAIPVGGFVKIKGMSEDPADAALPGKSFNDVSRWQRLLILLAGIVMNYGLAVVLLAIGFMIGLPGYLGDRTPANANVINPHAIVYDLSDDAPASESGLQAGDTLLSVNETPITKLADVQAALTNVLPGQTITLGYERDNANLTTQFATVTLPDQKAGLGLYIMDTGLIQLPFFAAIQYSVTYTWELAGALAQAVGQLVSSLLQGQNVSDQVSGPVGIASLTYQAAQAGLVYVLQLAALLSLNLALFNLLPFPPLDGGKLVVVLVEMIMRRPVPLRWQIGLHNAGFILFLVAIALITLKDVFNLFA